jgi:hypothetical protein
MLLPIADVTPFDGTHQDLSNDATFGQIKSRVSVPLKMDWVKRA